MNNLRNIIVTKDIYFIYIGENISKKLINKKVVTSSKRVVTCYFSTLNLLPYYFFCSNTPVQHDFCTGFVPVFPQKSKKICQFFAIFSRCVSMIYEKVEKIISQNT